MSLCQKCDYSHDASVEVWRARECSADRLQRRAIYTAEIRLMFPVWQLYFRGTSKGRGGGGAGGGISSLCPRLFYSTCTGCEISPCLATFARREIIQEEPELFSTTRFWNRTTLVFKRANLILNHAELTLPGSKKSGSVAHNSSHRCAHRRSSELLHAGSRIPGGSNRLLSS